MASFSKLSLTPVLIAGAAAVGAKVYVYDAGGLTPRTVYQDAGTTVPHPSPIVLPATGRIPPMFLTGTPYRVIIRSKSGSPIEDVDNIPADDASSASTGTGGSSTSDLITGDVIWSYRTGTRINFVRMNGRTIGSALSGASELAGDAAQSLFLFLWTADPNLVVSGGRGATASADFAANKTLTLPDGRARALLGLDDMGSAAAGRLSAATFLAGTATTLGATAGTASETLTSAQIGAHSHTGSTAAVAGHAHTGTTYATGGHSHSASSGAAGSHSHTGSTSAAGSHSHGGATSQDGYHAHTGATSSAGDHTHSYGTAGDTQALVGGNAVGGYWRTGPTPANTSTAGAHTHNFTTDGSGSHGHSISTDTAPNHAHSFTTDGVGDHSHTISVTGVGDHAHGFATDTAGAHAHSLTTDLAGGGGAHNNLGPSILGTFYMRL